MWVFDATPLIYLAKVGRLDLIDHLHVPRVIPGRVHREVVTDGRIDRHEARETIDAMVDAGWYCAPDVYANIVATIESRS